MVVVDEAWALEGLVINNATEGKPLSVSGRGTRQRGGGCALVGGGG